MSELKKGDEVVIVRHLGCGSYEKGDIVTFIVMGNGGVGKFINEDGRTEYLHTKSYFKKK